MGKEADTPEKPLEKVAASMVDLLVGDLDPEYDEKKHQNIRQRQIWLDEHQSVFVSQIEQLHHPGNNRYIVQLMTDNNPSGGNPVNLWEQWKVTGDELTNREVDLTFNVKEVLAEAIAKVREDNG